MRILRLINDKYEEAWLLDKGFGVDWSDHSEIIITLARPHNEIVEVKEIFRGNCETVDEYGIFDSLWEDEGTVEEFQDLFDTCFELAEVMI